MLCYFYPSTVSSLLGISFFFSFFYISADNQPPVITCPPNQVTGTATTTLTIPGATATDDSGIAPTISYTSNTPTVQYLMQAGQNSVLVSNLNLPTVGSIETVTATATDNAGLTDSCTFQITATSK